MGWRSEYRVIFTCDLCEEGIVLPCYNLESGTAKARKAGWTLRTRSLVRYPGGRYQERRAYCPDCKEAKRIPPVPKKE